MAASADEGFDRIVRVRSQDELNNELANWCLTSSAQNCTQQGSLVYVAPATAQENVPDDQPAFMQAFGHFSTPIEMVETHDNGVLSGNNGWTCCVCTYCHEEEQAQFLQCAICGTPRTPSESATQNSEPASGFNSNQQAVPVTSSNKLTFNPNAGAFKPSWMADSEPAVDEP